MVPQPENRGGLIGQLRDYALKASDEQSWGEGRRQHLFKTRSVNLRTEVSDVVKVELLAKRAPRIIGRAALQTEYTLQGSYIQAGLPLEFLPAHVLEALRRPKVRVGEDEPETLVIRTNDEEVDEYEFDGYDEMLFRHVNSVQYTLNGRGSLKGVLREDFYEDDDEGGVDIVGLKTYQHGTFEEDEKSLVSLMGWGKEAPKQYPTELLLHPDLRKLEEHTSIEELNEDLAFLTIVENYMVNKDLLRHSHIEHRRSMLTLFAFLNMEASAKDVLDLL